MSDVVCSLHEVICLYWFLQYISLIFEQQAKDDWGVQKPERWISEYTLVNWKQKNKSNKLYSNFTTLLKNDD